MLRREQHQQHWPRQGVRSAVRRLVSLGVVVSVSSAAFAAASRPSPTRHQVKISAAIDGAAVLRRTTYRAITLPFRYACDRSTVGEIDAMFEQPTSATSRRVHLVRNIAMSCDPNEQRVELVFESESRLNMSAAVVRIDISAGFGEDFRIMHLAPTKVAVR